MQQAVFPTNALDWLSPGSPARVLIVGRASGPLARGCHLRRHELTLVDPERDGVAALLRRAPLGMPVVAAAEALPFPPCTFDAILLAQGFHLLAPGLALAEFARVLRPGGRLGIAYTVRDDSVPWVKRLVARLQEDDPRAMRGDYGTDSLAALDAHPCFPHVESHAFRLWVPVDRTALLTMVERTPALARLDADRRAVLLDDVAALYEGAARPPEPLLLPYTVRCWRSTVDHSDLSAPLELDDALHISL